MGSKQKLRRDRLPPERTPPLTGSTTSYEDIPEAESGPNVLSSSNRYSVMSALQNLQEKIHRLEINRCNAVGDMECLANETARFRRMLSVPVQDEEPTKEAVEEEKDKIAQPSTYRTKRPPNCFGFRPEGPPMTDSTHPVPSLTSAGHLPTFSGHPDVVQPTLDFHNCSNDTRVEPEVTNNANSNAQGRKSSPFFNGSSSLLAKNHQELGYESHKHQGDSSSVPSSSYHLPPQTPQAVAIALTSAETRCSILEQQLSYMRTLLEAAERDRNEAQRRCRHRGEEFQKWRRSVEAQLSRLEADLDSERGRNRLLCEQASSPQRRQEKSPCPLEAPERPPKPCPAWQEVPARPSPSLGPSSRRPPRSAGTIPFVAGKATTPSHNVGLSLQAVMQMAHRKSAVASISSARGTSGTSGAVRRRQQSDQVDRQLGQDVRVVLEELLEEYEALCRLHKSCAQQLASASTDRAKEELQHQLNDLVNSMDVKGQQIGRLRAYLASVEGPSTPSSATATAEAESERRARSIRFLNKARQLQSLGMDSDDLDWR